MRQADKKTQVAVRVRDLKKNYGTLVALDGVSFEVSDGCVFSYLGPNGAGKTTTINILCGLLDRDGGDVSILGRDVVGDPVYVKSRIGVVTENSNLYPELHCRRNLEYLGELYGLPGAERRKRAEELLRDFGLLEKADAPFGSLSRGMKRRLTIGAALVHRPAVLFLDEPTTGLDVPSAKALRGLVRRIADDGTTVLLTTHNLFEAEELASDVAVLVGGRVVARGSVDEIKRRVGGARSVAVRFSDIVHEDNLTAACPAVKSAKPQDGLWRLDVSDLHDALGQLVAFCRQRGCRIEDVGAREPTLEDAFVSLLTGAARPDGRNGP
ncbi:MAG: ABC transporter ATP-binding protein [Thermodesulfobacteriota bacterium]|nr:ABC transporter ATP-binding protein [Thermodesulfobacteriota bacterium]